VAEVEEDALAEIAASDDDDEAAVGGWNFSCSSSILSKSEYGRASVEIDLESEDDEADAGGWGWTGWLEVEREGTEAGCSMGSA
jgi:hypothetical protein